MAFALSKIGVKKNIPKVNFTSYSGLFVAPPKFGKTTTASMFPNAIIVPFEDGVKGQVANVVEDIADWQDFLDFIDKLEDNREEIGNSVETIVFDTVNKAWDMSEPYTLKKLSIADKKRYTKPSDIPHGQFYPARDKYFSEALDRILNLGFSILFLSHSKVKTVRPKNEEPYDIYSSTMHDRLEAIVNPLVDFMLYGENRIIEDKPLRALITKGNTMASSTGNRVFIDEDIVFETEEEAMKKYQEKFKKTIVERLQKSGINEDYDSISKKQEEEKMADVKKYVETRKKEDNLDDLISQVTDGIKELDSDQQKELKKWLKDTQGSVAYKKFEDEQSLKDTIEKIKEIKG